MDVVINVYGKPMQTAVALFTLLRHSGQHIGRIWFIEERGQPHGARFGALKSALSDRITVYRPALRIGWRMLPFRWMYRIGFLRRALRYQVAWERSTARYLFHLHNDMFFHGDLLGAMLARIDGHTALGPVGQCWNCSARRAGVCSSETFMSYRPGYAEWLRLSTEHPGARADQYGWIVDPQRPWPLPECRVNEWAALVDLSKARPATLPRGPAIPFGALHGLDIGTAWFHEVVNAGHSVRHFDIAPYATHAWASSSSAGRPALFNRAEYDRTESAAREYLSGQFPTFIH